MGTVKVRPVKMRPVKVRTIKVSIMKMKDMKIKKKTNPINLLSNIDFSHKRFSSLFPSLFPSLFSSQFSSPRFKPNFQNKITATKLAANKITASIMAASKMPASIMAASKITVIKLSPNKLSADQLAMSKLAISFALLLLLAACGGDTGGTGDNNPPKGDKGGTSEVNKCAKEPIPKGCPGYIIKNPYLDAAIDATIFDQFSDDLFTLTEVKYGTIANINTKTSFTTADYFNTAFTEATGGAEKDNTKNNIIKITGKQTVSGSAPETDYYYSHIKGNQFERFLPAINKFQILALGAKHVTQDNVPDSGGLIFDSDYKKANAVYKKLRGLVVKAKDLTFKGFALVTFSNNYSSKLYLERYLYPGKFILTFNSSGFETGDLSSLANNNFFSMKITLDQTVTAQDQWPTENDGAAHPDLSTARIVDSVNKPEVATIEIKNFNLSSLASENNKTYSEDSGTSKVWKYSPTGAYLAFNQTESGDIDQIAGRIFLSRTEGSKLQALYTTFASNEFCNSGAGRANPNAGCPAVTLTD